MKDLKYLLAYVAPFSAVIGLYFQGWLAPGSFYVAFVFIPFLELFKKGTTQNFTEVEEDSKAAAIFFDILLYLNLPILFALLGYFFYCVTYLPLTTWDLFFSTINIGIVTSTIGINVAHELGHRQTKMEQLMSKVLLTTALYTHFFVEHNRGHHKNVATYEDPASARLNEALYAFWFRSSIYGYLGAWRLEANRLTKMGKSSFSLDNEVLVWQVIQLIYLLVVGIVFGATTALFAIAVAVVAFLLLETVNYIEHYGLARKRLSNGRYENVQPWHSWNSNHDLGRIYLYELTRHSDHHYKATRKYQVLRSFKESPQLPFGYPGSMLISTIPPVWFKLMNKRVASVSAG